jgi:hypothetical protein
MSEKTLAILETIAETLEADRDNFARVEFERDPGFILIETYTGESFILRATPDLPEEDGD